MGRRLCLLVAIIAFAGAGAGSASAQASLAGSLDCQVVYPASVALRYFKIRCLYLPLHGYPPGFEQLTGSLTPKGPPPSGLRTVWGVYSQQPLSSLAGTYARRTDTRVLVSASATELRPIANVPGEEIGHNLAFDATALILVVP